MNAADAAITIVEMFGVSRFTALGRQHEVVVSRVAIGPGYRWRCGRCRMAGAYYGANAIAPLARFMAEHTGETCPC